MGTHRALRGLLLGLSILAAVAGFALLFQTQWALFTLPTPAEASMPILLLLMKAFGAIAIGLAWLLYAASRDPLRYVAVIDAFIGMLLMLTIIELYAAAQLHFTWTFPGWFIWLRVTIRIGLAAALFVLRPRTRSG